VTVYHWTTQENALLIMQNGLRQGSFVVATPNDWHGEVCLVIEDLNIYTDEDVWQGITHRWVSPKEIAICDEKERK
jgi:hypothetical protein